MFSLLRKETYDVVTFIRTSWITFWQVTFSTYCKSVFRAISSAASSDVDLCDIDVNLSRWISPPYIIRIPRIRNIPYFWMKSFLLKFSISQCCSYCKQFLDEPSTDLSGALLHCWIGRDAHHHDFFFLSCIGIIWIALLLKTKQKQIKPHSAVFQSY